MARDIKQRDVPDAERLYLIGIMSIISRYVSMIVCVIAGKIENIESKNLKIRFWQELNLDMEVNCNEMHYCFDWRYFGGFKHC